jgi:hypothetical protein
VHGFDGKARTLHGLHGQIERGEFLRRQRHQIAQWRSGKLPALAAQVIDPGRRIGKPRFEGVQHTLCRALRHLEAVLDIVQRDT